MGVLLGEKKCYYFLKKEIKNSNAISTPLGDKNLNDKNIYPPHFNCSI